MSFVGRDLREMDSSLQSGRLSLHPTLCILPFHVTILLHYSTGWTAALGFSYNCITTALIGPEFNLIGPVYHGWSPEKQC